MSVESEGVEIDTFCGRAIQVRPAQSWYVRDSEPRIVILLLFPFSPFTFPTFFTTLLLPPPLAHSALRSLCNEELRGLALRAIPRPDHASHLSPSSTGVSWQGSKKINNIQTAETTVHSSSLVHTRLARVLALQSDVPRTRPSSLMPPP